MTDLATFRKQGAGIYSPTHTTEQHVIAHRGRALDGSTRGILSAHAAGQNAYQGLLWQVPLYLAHRWPLAIADCGDPAVNSGTTSGPFNWGNDTAISRMGELRTFHQTVPVGSTLGGGAKAGTLGGFGGSMAATTILNVARANPSWFCCIGLVIPTLDVDDIYQNDRGGLRAGIGGAYGVVYPTALPGLATHSPVAASPSDFTAWPIKLWASDNDNVASSTASCQTWANAVNSAGGQVEVASIGAVGHNTASTPIDDVISWFVRHMAA